MAEDKNIRLIQTDDGSHSLYVPALNETYHSFHGAVQESRHVFIEMGLDHFFESTNSDEAHIFEVGFGTGLNALLTAEYADKHKKKISYVSIEAYPVEPKLTKQLNYTNYIRHPEAASWFKKMHDAQWNVAVDISPYFNLTKIEAKLEEHTLPEQVYDVIYFDAFAPNKQSELWETSILKSMANALRESGNFVTYCARGQLKRDLAALQLQVETLPGPPGKKEMVRAKK